MNQQVVAADAKSENLASTAKPKEALRLFVVMSPWHPRDPARGTFEEKVWAQDDDHAARALAERMADEPDSGCETDEDRATWVVEHLESTEHLMVVTPCAPSVEGDIHELLQGPDDDISAEAKADFEAIKAILAKYI